MAQALADRAAAQADLDALLRGARQEELAIKKTTYENAVAKANDSVSALSDILADAYIKSDDAIRNKVDAFISNARNGDPVFMVPIPDTNLKNTLTAERNALEALLITWSSVLETIPLNPQSYIKQTEINLGRVIAFLDKISQVVNVLTSSASLTQTTIDSYKSNVITARVNVNTASKSLTTAKDTVARTKEATLLAEQEYLLTRAGASDEEVRAQQASIAAISARIDGLNTKLSASKIRAPFQGTVTKSDVRVGESIAANVPLITVHDNSELLIEAFIPEVDIAHINTNSKGTATLDAFSDEETFDIGIISIDPAETIIEGVATYKTKLFFYKPDVRVRSGMTANIDLIVERKENTLAVPRRAIETDEDGSTVLIRNKDGGTEKRPVTTGIRSTDGYIEILSGLSDQDVILVIQ